MTYGGGNWAGQNWLPDEEEAIKHIKYACVLTLCRIPY